MQNKDLSRFFPDNPNTNKIREFVRYGDDGKIDGLDVGGGIIDQDLNDPNFVPLKNTYYRHIGKNSYSVLVNIPNGSAVGKEVIVENETIEINLSSNVGYVLPDSITVEGASYTYTDNITSGKLRLSNPTKNVEVTITCVAGYKIVAEITNGTISGSMKAITGQETVLIIHPEEGYRAPLNYSDILVENASKSYAYHSDTKEGYLGISDATAEVRVVATCSAIPVTFRVISHIENGVNLGMSEIEQGGSATVIIVPNEGYLAPSSISQDNVSQAVYQNDYYIDSEGHGCFTVANPLGTVTITLACVEDTSQYPKFEMNESIVTGDTILFDNSKSDPEMLAFCQSFEPFTEQGGTTVSLVAQTISQETGEPDGAYVGIAKIGTIYAFIITGGNEAMKGWWSDAFPDAGIESAGWNVPANGEVEMTGDMGTIGYLNSSTNWNGQFVGLRKGT